MTEDGLPFFVYGTLLPGERNHDRFLTGRVRGHRPAVLPGALLYHGPGYPYAVEGPGEVRGALVTAAPGAYCELVALLDELEGYLGPGHPRNLYERVARPVVPRPDGPDASDGLYVPDGPHRAGVRADPADPARPVRAWVYLAGAAVTRSLCTGGTPVPGGDWLARHPRPGPGTP
ncbi:gamma-glutamylcyclotransferase family protein [Streptomyces halstedii]|uniref:Gamma-glutamylcyclotransferase n=1 Tax=Streptomyces halstedii TaxID=1944 RepID=A0A6N9U5K0_STRHA|nr:gamma-glutamylcyclotransferase [Streptomyces halstedii]